MSLDGEGMLKRRMSHARLIRADGDARTRADACGDAPKAAETNLRALCPLLLAQYHLPRLLNFWGLQRAQ